MNNLQRYQLGRSRGPELGVIAGHLDFSSLETLPSILKVEIRQSWPVNAKTAYDQAHIRNAIVIPDLGLNGTVCLSTDRRIHVWTVGADQIPLHYRTIVPVNADVLCMYCADPPKSAGIQDQKLLVLAYELEVCILGMSCRDEQIQFRSTNMSTEIAKKTTAICSGCDGRVFIGSNTGHVYELHCCFQSLLKRTIPGLKACYVKALGWTSPVYYSPVQKMFIDEDKHVLIVISDNAAIAIYTLGEDGGGVPIRRTTFHPSSNIGHYNFYNLLTILPMPEATDDFKGMCIFKDGNRMKIQMTHEHSSIWNTFNWATDWAVRTDFNLDASSNSIPLARDGDHQQVSLLTHLAHSDNTWLMVEKTGGRESLSVLHFYDSAVDSRIEKGAVFLRDQMNIQDRVLAIGKKVIESSTEFTTATDFVSSQFDPPVVRHLVLEPGVVTVAKIKTAAELLTDVLLIENENELTSAMKEFCRLYGSVETAALLCLVGLETPKAIRLFGREDIFGEPKKIFRKHRSQTQQLAAGGQVMSTGEQQFAQSEAMQTEEDIEFSDSFKGCVLLLRQLLRPFWWKNVIQVTRQLATTDTVTNQTLPLSGMLYCQRALKNIHDFMTHHVYNHDPRVGTGFQFAGSNFQIEVHEMMALMLFVQRCVEALMLLIMFKKREIDSIASRLSDDQCERLNQMAFNGLVYSPKSVSPITPLLKESVDVLEMNSTAYKQALAFFVERISTFWNHKDTNEYEAIRTLKEKAKEKERSAGASMGFSLINGPFKDRNLIL